MTIMMYGCNGHNPPVVKTAKQERTDENGGQPVECPQCGSYNEEPREDGSYFCWLCEYEW